MKQTFNMSQYRYSNFLFSFFLLTFCTSLLFFFASPTHAAVSYTATPIVISLNVDGRDIQTRSITLTNTGTVPVTLFPSVNNISVSEGGALEEFLPAAMSDRTQSLASWIEVSRAQIELQPGATRELLLTVRMHPNPVPGTYHALIGFGNGRNRDIAEEQVRIGVAPGVIISVTVDDNKITLLRLSRFIVDKFVTSRENQAASYTFRNTGDETVIPTGEIILYSGTGKEVGNIPVNTNNISIAPGEEYVFEATVPVDGMLGKYKAFLNVQYGTTQRASVQDTSFFYVFPLKTMLVILGVLLFLVAFISWYVHRKYFDDDDMVDDSERLMVHVRGQVSDAKHHDIDLKNKGV